jgi:hypothetical protein
MHAENLYNGPEVAGCRFSFWIPLQPPRDNTTPANPQKPGVTA